MRNHELVEPSQISPELLEQFREIASQMEARGLAPAGNRVVTDEDFAEHLGQTPVYWSRHRWRLIKAGLMIKAQRRWVADLRKVQEALADPAFWADKE